MRVLRLSVIESVAEKGDERKENRKRKGKKRRKTRRKRGEGQRRRIFCKKGETITYVYCCEETEKNTNETYRTIDTEEEGKRVVGGREYRHRHR